MVEGMEPPRYTIDWIDTQTIEKLEEYQSSDIICDLRYKNVKEILNIDLPSDEDDIEQSSDDGDKLKFNE